MFFEPTLLFVSTNTWARFRFSKGSLKVPSGISPPGPNGIDIAIDKQTHITVLGVDRQLVGQIAANIRRFRKPDPYKQKGVRYTGEVLKKKAGKTGAKA